MRRIWFEFGATQQYYPVTHSAFWVMHRLWGDHTLGYHMVNIVLHAVSAFLVALLLRRVGAPGAILAAVVFALHPVHVESVAWMTELKNTLSGSAYLGAAYVYLDFDERRRVRPYVLALVLFMVAVLSKSVTATLPAALVLVVWWKRGRVDWRRDVLPLLPFFAMGVAAGLTTAWVERTLIGADGSEFQFTFVERCLMAGRAIWFYLGTLAWPAGLAFMYPRWDVSQEVWWQYLYPTAALALVAGLWLVRVQARAPLAVVLFFGGTLFPALGFFNVYPFVFSFVADHFQYLASIGIIALAAGGLATLAERWHIGAAAGVGAVVLMACLLGTMTWRQSRQYADVESLYRTTIRRNPECWLCENNLGDMRFHESPPRLTEAAEHFMRALSLNPNFAPAHNNLGMAWQEMGRVEESLVEFAEAARLQPRFASPLLNQASALRQLGRLTEATAPYEELLRIKPGDVETRNNLAGVLLELGRPREAVAHLERALTYEPGSAFARANLPTALVKLGDTLTRLRPEEAIGPYLDALKLKPDSAEAHNNLAGALLRLQRTEEAVTHLREAVRLVPNSATVRANLASALATLQSTRRPDDRTRGDQTTR